MEDKTIEELRQRLKAAEEALAVAQTAYYQAMIEISPFKVGMRMKRRRDGRIAEITELNWRFGEVLPYGKQVLKSGKLHKIAFPLEKWEGWTPV